jgi:hypothetical protein
MAWRGDLTLDRMKLETVAGHQVLWIETTDKAEETSTGTDDSTMFLDVDEMHQVTMCVVGDAKTPTRCPIQGLPLESSHSEDKVDDNGSDAGLESWVGPHKLW